MDKLNTIKIHVFSDTDEWKVEEAKYPKWFQMSNQILESHWLGTYELQTRRNTPAKKHINRILADFDAPVVLIY